MSLATIAAAEAMQRLASFHTVIDARSPAEYAEDHLPGAVNWPVLDDDERREQAGRPPHFSGLEGARISRLPLEAIDETRPARSMSSMRRAARL